MIKLIDYILFEKYGSKEIFISKDMIHTMQRNNDGMTNIIMKGGSCHTVKETPEEILTMPDIEEGSKVIDWEQRRYEIAKHVLPQILVNSNIKDAVWFADILIDELKKVDND